SRSAAAPSRTTSRHALAASGFPAPSLPTALMRRTRNPAFPSAAAQIGPRSNSQNKMTPARKIHTNPKRQRGRTSLALRVGVAEHSDRQPFIVIVSLSTRRKDRVVGKNHFLQKRSLLRMLEQRAD